jgi:hypothetical protein
MTSGAANAQHRVKRQFSMVGVRQLVRRGLNALAASIPRRSSLPPVIPTATFDERPLEIGRQILGELEAGPQNLGQQVLGQQEIGRQILGQQSMLTYHSLERLDRSLLLQGRIAARQLSARERIGTLADAEFRVSSQFGDDGIIEWLCQKIPGVSRSFVEFGVESFAEANTRFLIENRGWRGLVMDGNDGYMRGLRDQALYWRHDLTAVAAFITAENINALISEHGFAGELGILSVDIDGNDYWVLDAIDCVNPAIIICEINGVFGDLKAVTVPYRPDFQRMDAHYSGQYFGCSLAALRLLCERRGYSFIGTNSNGVNAFFVRNDFAGPVLDSLVEVRAWAPRHRDSRGMDGRLDFVRGVARRDLVADMPVVDITNGRLVPLSELYPLYSDTFLEDFR